jgi:hypothetical protein
VTFSNDTPIPTSGSLLGDRRSQAFAALHVLRVLPEMLRRLDCDTHSFENAGNDNPGDHLVWQEAAIDAIAVHWKEHFGVLRQTPLDRIHRN